MKKIIALGLMLAFSLLMVTPVFAGVNQGFIHGIIVPIDGEDYYLAGPPDGLGGEKDVPGHEWIIAGKTS